MSLLGIDIGTTVCKAAAFSREGRCLASASRQYDPYSTELDTREVWAKAKQVIAEVAMAAEQVKDPISALSISSLGEAMAPVTARREILGASILCFDPRGEEHAQALRERFTDEGFYRINGNHIGRQYSLPKLLWLRENARELYDKADHFLLFADFIAFMLGAEPCASSSLASRTLLLDFEQHDWSDALLNWSQIPREKLGRVVRAGTVVGKVSADIARELHLSPSVQIIAGGHDQCCNSLGCGAIQAGSAVCGLGTFQCITPTFNKPSSPLAMFRHGLNIEDHVVSDRYVAFLFNQAGSLVKWFRETFAAELTGEDVYAKLNASVPDEPTNLLVLPHFQPPVWPSYIPDTAGAIVGLQTTTTRGEIYKAIMECTNLYFLDHIQSLEEMGMGIKHLIASGGGARSDPWLQITADIFNVPVSRLKTSEGGLAGAAMLAGIGSGVYASPEQAVQAMIASERTIQPNSARHSRYREKAALYRRLYPALAPLHRDLVAS